MSFTRHRAWLLLLILLPSILIGCRSEPAPSGETPTAAQPIIAEPTAGSTAVESPLSPPAPTQAAEPEAYPLGSSTPIMSAQGYPIEHPTAEPLLSDYTPIAPTPVAPPAGQGTVTGVLVRDVIGMPWQPIVNIKLFLAKFITQEGDPVALASLDENKAPMAVTDDRGQFMFVGVEPGRYALIIKSPISAILAHDVVKDVDVMVDVVADQVFELDAVHVDVQF
jgi:hypothetical protein